jgi:dolichol-phosphate mannosyltransferase
MDLSVVIPVRNEEENLAELTRRLHAALGPLSPEYEIIYVTDLNRDNTVAVLRQLNQEDGRVKALKLSSSFGQHVAVMAGLAHARGAAVVIMDGDLQDYPEDIPALYARLRDGHDIVYGTKQRKNDSALRNWLSRAFLKVLGRLSDFDMDLNTSMFRIISRRVVNAVLQFRERDPSLTFIMGLVGFPTARVQVTSGSRQHGQTNYSFWRQINLAVTSLISFSTKPLRIVSLVGIGTSGLALVYFLIALGNWALFRVPVVGWTSLVALMALVGGAILFAQGITGEYIARMFLETKRRPLYIVEEHIGISEESLAKLSSL